ncbi:MAG: transcriptional regulator, family [Cellvibrio sp.]|nr:transcriptional regulator, family [Cellvibrio sp.]
MKQTSRLLNELQATTAGLHKAGVISARRMNEYETLRNLEVQDISPHQIKALRLREHLSQAVMAAVLNVSTSALQKWESGDNKPNGPSLRLLNIIEKKGLEAIL